MEMVDAVFDDTDAVEDYKMQKEAEDPIAFAASQGDPDTLSYKDALGAIDSWEYKTAMVKEANDHATRETWEIWEKKGTCQSQDPLFCLSFQAQTTDRYPQQRLQAQGSSEHTWWPVNPWCELLENLIPSRQLVLISIVHLP
jgi:hypothetical protein